MKRSRSLVIALAVPLLGAIAAPASAQPRLSGPTTEFSVLANEVHEGYDVASAEKAVRAAGGAIITTNIAAGLITASAPANGFLERISTNQAVFTAAKAKTIGVAPKTTKPTRKPDVVETEPLGPTSVPRTAPATSAGLDPLDGHLWGLTSVRSNLSRTVQPGDKRVKVGIIDTGIDGSHPDIAPNFDRAASRNFTRDIVADVNGVPVDGPCEYRGCVDPPDVDQVGHGTHVAGIIGAAANGYGVSGVAPNVTLVSIRAAQDSGFWFLQPTIDAITYAGDAGIDVINMSFYIDPWLYNCTANTADSPAEQSEQRTVIEATRRALNYAHRKGVTQVVALGNQHSDLAAPQPDASSPDYPANSEHPRQIDNASCLTLPAEGPHTIGVAAFGPSQAKADYSNYGVEQISVSAPGGYKRDYFGTPQYDTRENEILSAYPRNVGVAAGYIDDAGNITPAGANVGIQKAPAPNGRVGYYRWLQGTSMAAPHAVGVAALIVSQYGTPSRHGFGLNPDAVQRVLEGTASDLACPTPRTVDYLDEGRDASYTATCTGDASFNSFYGHGTVDAWSAVTRGRQYLRG